MFRLIAVRDAEETGPLVHDHADNAYCKEKRKYDDDDQMDGVCKHASSSLQSSDDRHTCHIPCDDRERKKSEGYEYTGNLNSECKNIFGVQFLHGSPAKQR